MSVKATRDFTVGVKDWYATAEGLMGKPPPADPKTGATLPDLKCTGVAAVGMTPDKKVVLQATYE